MIEVKRLNCLPLLFPILFAVTVSAATVAVDATKTYQTIDGFGACSAWIGSKITDSLAVKFWQDDTINGHIGLSILRTRIDPGGYNASESSPMKKAIKVYPDIKIWSAAWTPPSKFKTNGSTVGGSLKSDATSQQGYADFLVKYVQDVKKNVDIDLYAVSCQNEPDFNPSYEGCQWTGDQFKVFVRDYWGPTCEKAGITAKRMISESYRNSLSISDPSLKDSAAAKYTDIIGGHLYGGGPNPYPLAETLHKQYWETENSGMGGPDESIGNGVMYANIVHNCLVKCGMNAYHYWWLVNNNNDDEGLCNSSGKPTPRMYTIGNFSKFVRPGYVRVDATAAPANGLTASAYLGAGDGKLVIVAINNGNSASKLDFTVAGFTGAAKAVPWITDKSHSLEKLDALAVTDDAFSCELPSKSVVSFVLWNGAVSAHAATAGRQAGLHAKVARSRNAVRIEVSSAREAWTVRIVLPSGRQVLEKSVEAGCSGVSLNGDGLSGKVFIVKVQQGKAVWSSRVVVP